METNHTKSATKSSRTTKTASIKTKTIKQKKFIPAPPQEIYDALLNEEKHSAFTGAPATCDRRVGGKFSAWDGYISGTNMVLEHGHRIVQEWKTTEWPNGYGPSILEFTLKQKGEGTEIRIVQTNVPASQASMYKQGWDEFYWMPLKNYFSKK